MSFHAFKFQAFHIETNDALFRQMGFKGFLPIYAFYTFFSIEAIHDWPAFIKRFSILLASILPTGMIILCRVPAWLKAKQVPEEIIWVLLLFILGLISSLLSEDKQTAFKSIALFLAAGPLIFVGTKHLFESTKYQETFLWINSLTLLALCFFGIYEHNYNQSDYDAITLFSGNPLPAGALLILLSTSPIILLHRQESPALKFLLALGPAISLSLIILSAKKSHITGLIIIFLCLLVFIGRKHLKNLLGFIYLAGILLFFSDTTRSKYKNLININTSILLRAENYFSGLHVFKKKPILGVGFKSELTQHLTDYGLKLSGKISKSIYHKFIKNQKTFENIILAFLVEWGLLFSFVYFSGLAYFVTVFWKKVRGPPKNTTGILIISVMIGFAVISLTFDTLRSPDFNWTFHSLLGLLANIPNTQTKSLSSVQINYET